MILKPGKLGIVAITGYNWRTKLRVLSVYKGMRMKGILTMNHKDDMSLTSDGYRDLKNNMKNDTDMMINIGGDATIFVEADKADDLFTLIDSILTVGEDAQKSIDNMLEAAQTLFFQDEVA